MKNSLELFEIIGRIRAIGESLQYHDMSDELTRFTPAALIGFGGILRDAVNDLEVIEKSN